MQAGAPLDVAHSDPGTAARLAVEGLLTPLDDVVDALGSRDAFLPNRLLIVNDHVYATNQAATLPQLFYRKDLFEAAGIAPFATWDEVRAAAEALHSDDAIGIVPAGGENRMTTIMAGTMLWQNCHDFFDADLNVILDHPKTVEAAAHYADLLQYSALDAAAWAFNEPPESFWSGWAAMVIHWHGLDLMIRQNLGLVPNVGIAPVTSNKMQVTQTGGRYGALFANSPTLEAGKAWIKYFFAPENAAKLTGMGPLLCPPATEAAMETLRGSDAATIGAFDPLLFDQVYPAAVSGYSEILHAGGSIRKATRLWIQASSIRSPAWCGTPTSMQGQSRKRHEDADPAEAVAEAA